MDKIKITFTELNGKRYATFHLDRTFASEAFLADYHYLPQDGSKVEVKPGDEEKLIAEMKMIIAEAEAAISRHEEHFCSLAETRELDVCGHKVAVHFKPWYGFRWHVEVGIPHSMKDELAQLSLLGEYFDNESGEWQIRDYTQTLPMIVRDKDEYFEYIEAEMTKAALRIEEVRRWRAQSPRICSLLGNVQVTIAPGDRPTYYEAKITAPKALIEKAEMCGLPLATNYNWWPTGHELGSTRTLRSAEEVASFIANLQSAIEETLSAEVVAEYSV